MTIDANNIYVLLPAYNEAGVIAEVIANVKEVGIENVIVIDDGSEDQTAILAAQAGAKVVQHRINLGAGAAVQTGIELARAKDWPYILFMDADGQHKPDDIFNLKNKMEEEDCDIVIGSRFLIVQEGMPKSRRFYNAIGNYLTNFFAKQNYSDSQSGLRMLNANAIACLNLEIDGFGFCSEMLVKAERANLKIVETPSAVIYTDYSRSKGQDFQMGFNTAVNFLWNTLLR